MTHPPIHRSISTAGVDLIKGFEGFSSKPYKDPVGVWTIGYGHTAGVTASSSHLTEAGASALLARDLSADYAPAVNALGLSFTQHEFDALVSFVYNLGTGIIGPTHTIGHLLRAGRFAQAADSMLLYDHAGSEVLPGLKTRREAERRLFLTP